MEPTERYKQWKMNADNNIWTMEIQGRLILVHHDDYIAKPAWFKRTFQAYIRILKAEKNITNITSQDNWTNNEYCDEYRKAKNNFKRLANAFLKNCYTDQDNALWYWYGDFGDKIKLTK